MSSFILGAWGRAYVYTEKTGQGATVFGHLESVYSRFVANSRRGYCNRRIIESAGTSRAKLEKIVKKKPELLTLEDINRIIDAVSRKNLSKVDVLAVCIIGCDYHYDFIRLGDVLFQTKVFVEVVVFKRGMRLGKSLYLLFTKLLGPASSTELVIVEEQSWAMVVYREASKYLQLIGQAEKAIWLGALIQFVEKVVEVWPEITVAYKEAVEFVKMIEKAINILPNWLEELIDRVKYYSGEL